MDFDEALDGTLMLHEEWRREAEDEGRRAGLADEEAVRLGRAHGRDLGREAGFAAGCCAALRETLDERRWARVRGAVEAMEGALGRVNWEDAADAGLSHNMETVRAKYKQVCAVLGLQIKTATAEEELF